MTCGCCLEACPQVNENTEFIGAAAKREIVVEICVFNCQYPKNWPLQALYHAHNVQGVGTINAVGDFSATSLIPNTIFVNGTAYFIIIDSNDTLVFVDPDAGVDAFDDSVMAGNHSRA